jgi:hypothetical protein
MALRKHTIGEELLLLVEYLKKGSRLPAGSVGLFEKIIEGGASIVGGSRNLLGSDHWMVVLRCGVSSNRHAGLEELAFVGLILDRDTQRHRLQALEASGGFEMCALFAAVQRSPAFGTFTLPIDIGPQSRGTAETAGRHHVLEQTGEPRAGNVDGRPWTRGPGAVGQLAVLGTTIGVHIAPLSVLTVVVHVLN